MDDIRFIAEWERCGAILMALPSENTDWGYILEEALDQYRRLVRAFAENGERVILLANDREAAEKVIGTDILDSVSIVEMDYNDTWTRDYGPLTVIKHGDFRALDFGFNAWGLKFAADKDNLVNLHLAQKQILNPEIYRNHRNFILEGGSVDSDGQGTVLTTSQCLCSPNRNGGLSKGEVNARLATLLGANHVLWLDYGALAGDDTDSHIDTLARLCPGNTIVYTGCSDPEDAHFEDLLKMKAQLTMFRNAKGDPYNLVELPLPAPVFDEDGQRLPATYANYLVTPRNLFIPVYGNERLDQLACMTMKVVYHDKNIVPVNCRTLLKQHGSLHCATMQMPEEILS